MCTLYYNQEKYAAVLLDRIYYNSLLYSSDQWLYNQGKTDG